MTPTLTVLRGLPASGKTTWALEYVAAHPNTVRVNRDDTRNMLTGKYWGLTHAEENLVTAACHAATRSALKAGMDVIVDATNLRPKYVREYRKIAVSTGAEFTTREFPVDVAVAVERDSNGRERTVGADVIAGMAAKFMPNGEFLPIPDEAEPAGGFLPYTPRTDAPPAILVDLDGTIAHMNGRGPYEYDRVLEDLPNETIIRVVRSLRRDHQIIFMSGRPDSCRTDTLEWIGRHAFGRLEGFYLFMRESGDNRRDSIVKHELFTKNVAPNFNVVAALDDRNQVVDMWREIGLTCLQVAPGDF